MKKRYLIIATIIFTQGCSASPNVSEYNGQNSEDTTCSYALNEFNKMKYYPIKIPVQKGFEKLAKKDFVNSHNYSFSNMLNRINIVNYPYIDKRCSNLNNILNNQNFNQQNFQLSKFRKQWLQEYRRVLQSVSYNVKFIQTDKCYRFARPYYKLLAEKNADVYMAKIHYNECLQIHIKER